MVRSCPIDSLVACSMALRYIYSPGRFFAVAELKAMLAWLILHYDVKMEKEGVFPEPTYFQDQAPPNYTAKVLFRKRQDKSML